MDSPRLAADLMVTHLVTLSPSTHVSEGISHLIRNNISGAPVVDEHRNYLGVFSEKCCLSVLSVTAQLVHSRDEKYLQMQPARDFMTSRLITLTPEMDVFNAIDYLLKNRISGAPVIDEDLSYLGVFSEKTSMQVLVDSAYDQMPTSQIKAFMNTDSRRIISGDTDLLAVMRIFLDTPYRRLPVIQNDQLIGQVSRRDVIRAQNNIAHYLDPEEKDHAILELSLQSSNSSAETATAASQLQSLEVAAFMDRKARIISPETDLFSIAHIFLSTPYRRLPVVSEGKLIGQISRRDVLQATHDAIAIPKQVGRKALYLSSIPNRTELPFS